MLKPSLKLEYIKLDEQEQILNDVWHLLDLVLALSSLSTYSHSEALTSSSIIGNEYVGND